MEDSLTSIPASIDRLLLEQGVYAPVELLLALRWLRFADYEAWRQRKLTTLERVLNGEEVGLPRLLEEAAVHAQALGLKPEQVAYKGWSDGVEELPLRAFDDDSLETAWCTHYGPQTDNRQIDLFIDNVAAALGKGISRALVAGQGEETDRLIARLRSHNPQSPQLDAFVALRAAQHRFSSPICDTHDALREMHQSIVPLARRALQTARDYLIPLWRCVADGFEDSPFDPERDEFHRSYAALMARDWIAVVESVEREPKWQQHGVLHLRRAVALDEQHLGDAARDAWFELCWCFPQQAETTFRAGLYPLALHGQSWQVFEDLDPPLTVTDYPAWQLLIRPDVARAVREPDAEHFPALRSFSLVRQLLVSRQSYAMSPDQQELVLRATLKRTNEALFEHFMRLHAVAP